MTHQCRVAFAGLAIVGLLASAAPGAAGDGDWRLGVLEKHTLDAHRLESAVEEIGRLDGVYSVLLVHGGELVVERYFREGRRDKPHNLKSASKSVLSALAGIALEEGRLRLDQPIADFLPQAAALQDPGKRAITLGHLLGMTSGLAPTSYESYNAWIESDDWVAAALEVPLVAQPGSHFEYSTGNTHLLSAVLTMATGMSTREYAETRLFEPMGIEIRGWQQDPKGIYVGGNSLSLTPRDMAKFGRLFLDAGRWGERQLVPRAWVRESTRPRRHGFHDVYGSYGFLWYADFVYEGAFVAVGFGGQYVYVSPPHDAVVVVTSTLVSKGTEWSVELLDLLRIGMLAQIAPSPSFYAELGRPPSDPALDSLERALERARREISRLKSSPPEREGTIDARRGRTLSRVNLRKGPDTAETRLALLERGEALRVLESADGWHRARVRDLEGWIFADYVELEAESSWRSPAARLRHRLEVFSRAAQEYAKGSADGG